MSVRPSIIVPGGLNTDFIISDVPRHLQLGELAVCGRLTVAPGGKSRNIAQMIAQLLGPGTVAMIGRTCRDNFNFWSVPYNALQHSGVNVEGVQVTDASPGDFPGTAFIPVDVSGRNQIYLSPGSNAKFSEKDVQAAEHLFHDAAMQGGLVALSLEMPIDTALYVVSVAKRLQMRVVLDPGGISPDLSTELLSRYKQLLQAGVDVLKPNEHEAQILSGVHVQDLDSARRAAGVFKAMGIGTTFITAGSRGAYLVHDGVATHIPVPSIHVDVRERDETGCGDQCMATFCAMLKEGSTVEASARLGVLAGTLQFYRHGVQPLTRDELQQHIGAGT
jgi:ribokinase